MKLAFKDRYLPFGLGLAIVSVLVVLAVLQYRWSNQVSEANETQIGANLQSLMTDWHFDVFRELSAIVISLQVGPDSGARDDWRDYVARYREWQQSSPNPGVVRDVLIWETSTAPRSRLLRLDTDTQKVEPSPLASSLNPLLERLQARSSGLPAALTAWALQPLQYAVDVRTTPAPGQRRRTDPMTGWQFDASIPALVHPIVHHALPGDHGAQASDSVDWIVVIFDIEYLQHALLPELTRRYFDTGDQPEYRIALVSSTGPLRTIYDSDPDARDRTPLQPDAEMDVFGTPPETTEGHVLQGPRTVSKAARTSWRILPAGAWFPVIQYGGENASWKLLVQHRNGSLAAMISGVRHRNLAISFGVLGLLAISMILVVVAAYRAQNFARLQMNFVAGISHELRTPLAVIASAAENIIDGVVSSKQMIKYGAAIHNQARQLSGLVEQILHFASTQEGRNRYHLRLLTADEIVRAAVENTRELLESEHFVLDAHVDPDLPMVRGDLSALSQCLQNLIVNAVKYGRDSRWIGVRALRAAGPGGFTEVQIQVEDRGPGIPASEIKQIFEPFYRTHAARQAQVRGTGLGLTLARTIAEEMHGRLTVVSRLKHGSTFTLHLPVVVHSTVESDDREHVTLETKKS